MWTVKKVGHFYDLCCLIADIVVVIVTLVTFRLECRDDYEYELKYWAHALRKFSPSKPKARAQYEKLVLVVVLVLQSEGRY